MEIILWCLNLLPMVIHGVTTHIMASPKIRIERMHTKKYVGKRKRPRIKLTLCFEHHTIFTVLGKNSKFLLYLIKGIGLN